LLKNGGFKRCGGRDADATFVHAVNLQGGDDMYVVVQHQIVKAETAFSRGVRLMTNAGAPAGVRVLQFYPSRDQASVMCLWESPSVAAVQKYVDDTLGDSSRNTSYEVDSDQAFARQPLGLRESAAVAG
jgi:hypothetical protein